MEITDSVPPLNNNGSGNLPKSDMQSEIDLQTSLVEKEKCLKVLKVQHTPLAFDLNIERSKNKASEVETNASCNVFVQVCDTGLL